jgi:hypothetical protein
MKRRIVRLSWGAGCLAAGCLILEGGAHPFFGIAMFVIGVGTILKR